MTSPLTITGAGASPSGIAATVAAHDLRAAMVWRDGTLVAGGDVSTPNNLHSARKALLGILIGRLVDAGELELDRPAVEFGIDDDHLLTDVERTVTVRQLLSSSSGVYRRRPGLPPGPLPLAGGPERPARGQHRPGEAWVYNNWDFNVAGSIYERVSGRSIFLAFDREVARPLGMQDWDPYAHARYVYVDDAIGGDRRFPNYRMRMSARDLLRVGRMMLDGGVAGTERVLSSDWVASSTRPVIATGLGGAQASFGYLWWVSDGSGALPAGSYSAFGLGGQFLTVAPETGTVMVGLVDTSVAGYSELTAAARDDVYRRLLAEVGV